MATICPGSVFMSAFKNAKMNFSGEDEDEDLDIRLPKECGIDDDEDRNIEDKILTVKRQVCTE